MNLRTLLDLGRVSNLPTVWTNVLAGAVLSGAPLAPGPVLLIALAASSFYVGGMFLNDAFDRDFDARLRPERPIPSGRATATRVFQYGFALLGAGLLIVSVVAIARGPAALPGSLAAGGTLAGLIVFYDAFHKGNPASALVMGLCRAALYGMSALGVGTLTSQVAWGALVLLAYVVGLTGVARQETRSSLTSAFPLVLLAVPFAYLLSRGVGPTPTVFGLALLGWILQCLTFLLPRRGPSIPRTVTGLIAGISLLDAALIAQHGESGLAVVACLGLPLTLLGQRFVRGT